MIARPGFDTENTWSRPWICAITCSAGIATSTSTSFADAPGNGTSTLAIVTLICGSSSRGVTTTANAPKSNASSATSGVSRDSRKKRAMRPEMPMQVLRGLQPDDTECLDDVLVADRLGRVLLHRAHEVMASR